MTHQPHCGLSWLAAGIHLVLRIAAVVVGGGLVLALYYWRAA